MINKDLLRKRFFRKVLWCVTENPHTVNQIWDTYRSNFPPNFIQRNLNFPATIGEVSAALTSLHVCGYVVRGLTRFTDKVLKEDTPTYHLSQKGREELAVRKI